MKQPICVEVNLTDTIRLKDAIELVGEGLEGIVKLTITGTITGDDFLFIRENMAETLQELDINNASIERNTKKFFELTRCHGLKSISIPDSVVEIEYQYLSAEERISSYPMPTIYRFDNPSLTSINVHPNNPVFSSKDGVLFNKDKTVLILYPAGRQGNYVIPDSVTKLGHFIFSGCSGLTTVTIPNTISVIEYAFIGCTGLTSINIPDSVTKLGHSAFRDCINLKSATIPHSVAIINSSAFKNCPVSLIVHPDNPFFTIQDGELSKKMRCTILNGVTKIAAETFKEHTRLISVTIPDSVKEIEEDAFKECVSLQSVTIPNSVVKIGNNTFHNCTGLKSVTISNSVTEIESWTFGGCSGLTVVAIPDSVVKISTYAFGFCTSLKSIVIPKSVAEISPKAFMGCRAFFVVSPENPVYTSEGGVLFNKEKTRLIQYLDWSGDYIVPDSVTEIGQSAFDGCERLRSVIIPNSVIAIGENAFHSCKKMRAINIPNSVSVIESGAFSLCTSLTTVTIPNSVKHIGQSAFSCCYKLKSVILNADTKMGWAVFSDCSDLESVHILDSVTKIGGAAFRGCYNLTTIAIPASVVEIEESAFEYHSIFFTVHPNNPAYGSKNGKLYPKR